MYDESYINFIKNFKDLSNVHDVEKKSMSNNNSLNYKPNNFKNITPFRGFDSNDPGNGRQNNYAWSFCDFNGYIYVGTGRNVTYVSLTLANLQIPLDYTPSSIDMCSEIWRYKKMVVFLGKEYISLNLINQQAKQTL